MSTRDGAVVDLSHAALKRLGLPDNAIEVLLRIRAELDADYRERFVEMATTMREQASALSRIQQTLDRLVAHLEPHIASEGRPVMRIAAEDEDPDIASAVVIAAPVSLGYSLSQRDVAKALRLPAPTVSVLLREWALEKDPLLAVAVRAGDRPLHAYHERMITKLDEYIRQNRPVSTRAQTYLNSARKAFGLPR